ncbi:MAG: precorrin-6y C5,15-methyltransferase (decarboxylating) subunit CbiE [cyanobacterium endosymbiont of Rhopalodia musculus]|uniref:precorrin-6y C5,15-methyltransferase (decarboxylating) subunit CbiE n=1 Tax=cyanobacterium endosymbiont of Epithemia clementina EcSB TaxID=3034674 RepID=UPI0024813ABC|nr:precorrin-6y C5,15-methyltransferase (decarboxylating) subunit CbiE [cyanobacterium endosymbiont of Epithemia clementina EcSB]WGT67796.1 precorrin-6y C5,15-methyltransferase (decarboxylating) subunit CbiE [cyanobacterium endosymbiont of Epithemia clementina EcSB]
MIKVIGIGLDGAIGLTKPVQEIVNKATLLVGSKRHLSYFPNHTAEIIVIKDLLEAIEKINKEKDNHNYIVILVSGDPFFFGFGRLLVEYFPVKDLKFYPHISSIQLVFNRLKIPWQDTKIISGHGREIDNLIPLFKQGVDKIAILTDYNNNPSVIARLYLSFNLPYHYEFWVCENLGDYTEKIQSFSAKELAEKNPDVFASLNIVVVLRKPLNNFLEIDFNELPLFGLPDHVFSTFKDRPGLITKREIRISILGELSLQNKQIVWDVGAGTGSVSVEIARLCPNSKIYALEKTAVGIALIQKNRQRLKAFNVVPIHGKAPDILANLPRPHRIFMGGSGGDIIPILEVCKDKLAEGGILVMVLATLENLAIAIDWFKKRSWDYQLLNLQVSRSVSAGNLTRFSPLNPIMLLRAASMRERM